MGHTAWCDVDAQGFTLHYVTNMRLQKKSVGVGRVLPGPHKNPSWNSDRAGCGWGGEGGSAH